MPLCLRPSLDHIDSSRRDDRIGNLQLLCRSCNTRKNALEEEVFRRRETARTFEHLVGRGLWADQLPQLRVTLRGALLTCDELPLRTAAPTPLEVVSRHPELLTHMVDVRGDHECWPYTGKSLARGRPQLRKRNAPWPRLHMPLARAILIYRLGRDLTADEVAGHSCDNPLCCNPDHLFLTDHAGNMADMVSKRRSTAGQDNPKAILTDEQVIQARREHAAGVSQKELCERYGVAKGTMSGIINRKTYRHL
jgi:hypothetical protein